jgi:phage/plasmid-associated DNA primase
VIGNKFPKVNDTTLAFQDRMMFTKFPNEYIGKAQIDDIEKVWLDNPQERSGILNWMLKGLHRLLSQGVFTESKSQKETMLEFQRVSDSISAFLTEQCIIGSNKTVARSIAFDCYKEYCDMIGTQPENDKTFTQRLKNTPKIKTGWVWIQGKHERAWKGFSVNPIQEENDTLDTADTLATYPVELEDSSNNRGSGEGVSSVTSVSNSKETVFSDGVSEVKGYKTPKQILVVKHTKNAEPCFYCGERASEYELDDNGSKYFVCETDLKEKLIPSYKTQGYEIKIVSEEVS